MKKNGGIVGTLEGQNLFKHHCKRAVVALPKTNSSPLKMVVSNRNFLFQGAPIFRCELLVSGRVVDG